MITFIEKRCSSDDTGANLSFVIGGRLRLRPRSRRSPACSCGCSWSGTAESAGTGGKGPRATCAQTIVVSDETTCLRRSFRRARPKGTEERDGRGKMNLCQTRTQPCLTVGLARAHCLQVRKHIALGRTSTGRSPLVTTWCRRTQHLRHTR